LIFGSLVLSINVVQDEKHYAQYICGKEICRYYIQVLSGVSPQITVHLLRSQLIPLFTAELLVTCLSELVHMVSTYPNHFDSAEMSLLNHIIHDKTEYSLSIPVTQRMLLLSLVNFSPRTRQCMLEDRLFLGIKKSPFLIMWMLSCSGSDEQYFLNTCDTASNSISLIAHHSTIATLLFVGMTILSQITQNGERLSHVEPAFQSTWSIWVPSLRQYALARCGEAQRIFTEIYDQALQYTGDGIAPPFEMLTQFVRRWNYAIQYLSSVFKPDQPVVLTRKLVPQRWHFNTFAMRVICSLTSFLPGQPHISTRRRSSHEISHIFPQQFHTFRTYISPREDSFLFEYYACKLKATKSNRLLFQQLFSIDRLWNKALFRGGVIFSSHENVFGLGFVGHLSFLLAAVLYCDENECNNNDISELDRSAKSGGKKCQKCFIIADPEIRNYRVLNFAQMFEMITKSELEFDLINVGFNNNTKWKFT